MVISALFRHTSLDSNIITITTDQVKSMFLNECKQKYEFDKERLESYKIILDQFEIKKQEKETEIERHRIGCNSNISMAGLKAISRSKQNQQENSNSINLSDLHELDSITQNIHHYKQLITSQLQIVESSKAVLDRYTTLVTVIEGATSRETDKYIEQINENDECPICMCPFAPEIMIYKCNHIFCVLCCDQLRKTGTDTCPICRTKVSNEEIIIVQNKKSIKSYGTKIDYILKILKKTQENEKIIIMTQFDNSIKIIQNIFNKNGFSTVIMNDYKDLQIFKNSAKILILSATSQSAGLDLSFASTMIMLEPPNGDYSFRKDLVKQIVGRIYRIGQTKAVKVITLIAEKTIEEQLSIDI